MNTGGKSAAFDVQTVPIGNRHLAYGDVTVVKIIPPSPLAISNSMLIQGDVVQVLSRLPTACVQSVVTSPPYWGLRDYGIAGQIGLEETLSSYLLKLTQVFSEVRRVLKQDGILWLNIGDGFTSGNRGWRAPDKKNPNRAMSTRPENPDGLKDKELLGVPWRLALSLQEDGWFLRNDIIWHKPNAMPESVKDRASRCHEYMFMFTKAEKYTYHYDAAKEAAQNGKSRNRRTVWSINTCSNGSEHIASFPFELVEPCIEASTREGEFVLDPFFGSGTVGRVCRRLRRKYIGIELNPDYLREAESFLKDPDVHLEKDTNGPRNSEQPHQAAFLETPGKNRKRARDV